MTRQSVWQVYNVQIAELRKQGHTLQEIGDRVGVTRERVRQILEEHYGRIEIPLLPECKAAELIGCNPTRLDKLRRLGIIQPKRQGRCFRYSREDIEEAMLALQKQCLHCGEALRLKGRERKYCPACSKECRRYYYPFYGEEKKRKHNEKTRHWAEQHQEALREIHRKATRKYAERKRKEHYAVTEYLVVRGDILPVGSVIKAVGCKNNHLILKDGLTIPTSWVTTLSDVLPELPY